MNLGATPIPSNPVEPLYRKAIDLKGYLLLQQQPTFASDVDDNFKKILIIAAGGYFETRICEIVISFTSRISAENQAIVSFVDKQAMIMRYHTLFDWKDIKGANKFFSLFGTEVSGNWRRDSEVQEDLKQGGKDFIDLGNMRNNVAHKDYAMANFETFTMDDIYKKYQSACKFLEYISLLFASL